MKKLFPAAIPHLVALLVFIVLSAAYFSPYFSGYQLRQGDIDNWRGMSKEILDYQKMQDEDALWTNSMFGGMPSFQINGNFSGNAIKKLDAWMKFGLPPAAGILFMSMLGFYILGLCMQVNPWLSIVGGVAFGFSSINILYLGAGHAPKINALAYMAPTLGGVLMLLRGKWLWGAGVTALFLSLHLSANHLQMTYYLLFLLFFSVASVAIAMLRKGESLALLKRLGILLVVAVIAVMPNLTNLLTTYEYSQYTTRAGSGLSINPDGSPKATQDKGLDKDYILEYSMGKGEVLSILIPDVKGGVSGYIGNDQNLLREVDSRYKQSLAESSRYWGEQRFTGGSFYFGAVMVLLFVVALFVLDLEIKWGLFALTMLALMLSWKEGGALSDFFLEKVPMYAKFRDTKMMLVLVQIMVPLLAVLFLDRFLKHPEWREGVQKKIWMVAGALALLLLLFLLVPQHFFDFMSNQDNALFSQALSQNTDKAQSAYILGLEDALIQVRMKIFRADVQRSLLFVLAAGGLLFLISRKKMTAWIPVVLFGVLVMVDLLPIDKRYLNNEKQRGQYISWEKKQDVAVPFSVSKADESIRDMEFAQNTELESEVGKYISSYIALDTDARGKEKKVLQQQAAFAGLNAFTNYRVLNLANPFSDASTSYYHKSIGGYHGAKLRVYQDLIDFHLSAEIRKFLEEVESKPLYSAMEDMQVLHMLNMKYIMANKQVEAIANPYAMGNAWFVNHILWVESADEEIMAIKEVDLSQTAVLHNQFKGLSPKAELDSSAFITMSAYSPNAILYQSESSKEQLAVFSEIYYPAGWKAYVDNEEVPYLRANYALRGLQIPSGSHQIEFRFEPQSYAIGKTLSWIGSLLVLLLFAGSLFYTVKPVWSTEK